MASNVEICNLALGHIGHKRILDLNENTSTARACKDAFSILRDASLRDGNWKFATLSVPLAPIDESVPGWSYIYKQPSDCLKLLKVFNEGTISFPIPQDFEPTLSPTTQVQAIVTNVELAWAKYVKRVLDPNLFDAKFIEYFSYRLGAALCVPLTGDSVKAQSLMQISRTVLAEADLINGREGSQQKPSYSSLIKAR
jgi:hypothetical protein